MTLPARLEEIRHRDRRPEHAQCAGECPDEASVIFPTQHEGPIGPIAAIENERIAFWLGHVVPSAVGAQENTQEREEG